MANEFLQPSFFDNSTAKNPDVDVALLEEQSNVRSILSLAGATTLQTVAILDGAITPTGAHIAVDTEGQAPADDLTVINPIRSEVDVIHDGMILQLQAVDDARVVTVKHSSEVGGIRTLTGQDIVLGTSWRLKLQYIGGTWVEIAGKAQIDADSALTTFSTTAAVGKAPVAMDDGGGNTVFDDSWKGLFGGVEITQTINSNPTQASTEKIPSEKAVSTSLQGKADTDLSNLTSSAVANAKIAPRPQTASGIGQIIEVNEGSNSYTLPAGGSWLYSLMAIIQGGSIYSVYAGVQSGGTTITGGGGTLLMRGFAWRIA